MNDFEAKIRKRLDAFTDSYRRAKASPARSAQGEPAQIRAQVMAYRAGLEDCLAASYVARLFKDYEFHSWPGLP